MSTWRVRVRHDAAGTTLSLPEGGATLLSRLRALAAEALNIRIKRRRSADSGEEEEEEEEHAAQNEGLLVLRGYPLQEVNACPPAQQTSTSAVTNEV